MAGAQQVRLLLWKDYLIRRRKPVTLAGILWAALVLLSLYIVRTNIDNVQHPTCQFAARALPSAGVLPFLQSFICNVNNECQPMEQYEEIPAYENARFTQIYREISPLINNATITGTAATVPDALKLLATLADVADTPTFLHIVRKGLFVKDLFRSPARVKRYLSQKLGVPGYVVASVMDAEIGIDALFKGGIELCDVKSMSRVLRVKDVERLRVLVERLCEADKSVLQDLVVGLLFEMDLGKYVQMLGDMYYKLSDDDRLVRVAEMVAGALRMTSLDSFLPPELPMIFAGRDVDFSYINLTMITRLMDAFKSTFGETESYKSLREVADTTVIGMQYLSNFVKKSQTNSDDDDISVKTSIKSKIKAQVGKIYQTVDSIGNVITDLIESDNFDIFKILPQVANIFIKWLPNDDKHEVILYSTMLAKLLQGAEKVIDININIEQWIYNVSLRNPQGVKILLNLPPAMVGKGLEALADVERTQIMVSKIGSPTQMFCDTDRLQKFFLVPQETSTQLKTQLCTDAWTNFTNDLLQSFGIKEVKNNINNMAAIFILEALGKDTTDYLYTIDKDFEILKNFTTALTKMDRAKKPKLDWTKVLNVSKNSEIMKVIQEKAGLTKHILITIHGTFAREVVTQNPLLSFKIATHLKKATVVIEALKEQLNTVPSNVTNEAKHLYPQILQTVIATARNEEKTYLSLSTPWDDIFCNGEENASNYVEFGANVNGKQVSDALCDISVAIENGMTNDSIIAKTIEKLDNMKEDPLDDVDWNELITGLNNLYGKLYNDYTYIFEYSNFGMDEALQKKMKLELKEVTSFWFNIRNLNRLVHVVLKFGFRMLDVMDHAAFKITHEIWLKMKYGLGIVDGPLQIAHDVISVISNTLTKTDVHSALPPITASLIQAIVPNVPRLVFDVADLITKHDLDIEPVIAVLNASPSWPCSATSLHELLSFNKTSAKTLQSVEALSCFDVNLQDEWAKYSADKNISAIKPWNSTIDYPDHVFLKFSATFDLFVKDLSSINSIVKETFLVDKVNDDSDFAAALEYIIEAVNNTDRVHFRKLLSKVDRVVNIIDTPTTETNITLNKLWKSFFTCTDDEDFEQCRGVLRLSLVRSMQFISMTLQAFSEDLYKYLEEANEPNASILKMLGFTSNTGLFVLYDRFGDFVSILVNSYLDLGFMSQVYRASQLEFWDCEDVTRSIRPGPGSAIDKAVIKQLEPFLCPSLFYWLSTPIGDNVLLDLIAKPQFLLFKTNISSFSSSYEEAYTKAMVLTDYAKELSINNNVFNERLTVDKIRGKMESTVDSIFTFRINKTDDSYTSFANVTETQTYATIYLTYIVTVTNKFADYIDKLNVTDVIATLNATEEDEQTIIYELNIIKKIPIRNPHHFIAFHFDLITYMLWKNDDNYTIIDALKYTCDSWKNKANNTNIVLDNDRIKAQICSKNYTILYEPASNIFNENTKKTRNSLVNFVRFLNKNTSNGDVVDISEYLKSRTDVIDALQTSVNYAHDLKIPVYLKYLHNNLRHYNVIVSFLSGGDWWSEFRSLYNTEPVVKEVLDTIENVFPIAEDILANVDRIHIARFMHDININNTAKFCQANVSVADYLPDGTRALRRLHRHVCNADRNDIISAIPPLHFAAQDFINKLKFSNDVDYDQVSSDVDKISMRIKDIEDGAKEPMRPQWITDNKLLSLREKILQLVSKESFTKISFGVISNMVDAGTLFLNNSHCTLCSKLTTWFKQINLQLYKKQEYDNLLCQMDHMTLEDIHNTLKYEFHWDMAFSELISTRNYTNHELNKSINEFLEQFKLHLLEDMTAGTTKITDCLAENATRNIFGNITLSARVVSATAQLIRSQLPHLIEVAGMTDVPFLQQLHTDVAHNLQVQDAFIKYTLKNFTDRISMLVRDQKLLASIENSRINLQAISKLQPVQGYLTLEGDSWIDVCQKYNCSKLSYAISDSLNKTLVQNNLPKLQQQEFWQFSFISNILSHVEVILDHLARLMSVASQLDIEGVMAGNLTSMLDTGIQIMMDDSLNSLLYSIVGLLDELQVVLHNTTLEHDINAITDGLAIIRDLKRYVIEQDMKVNLSQIFSNPEGIEMGFSQIGINNTNFWSIAAPRIHAGFIRLKPIFAPKLGTYHIKSFVCQVDKMSAVIVPGNIDVVTLDDVYAAVADQLCGISDAQAKQMIPVLLENLNYTYIFDKIKSNLLSKLYKASNLTQEAGDNVFNKFGEMTEIIPSVQNKLGSVADSLATEPLMVQLKTGGSFGDLLSGSDFLENTGKMMCGKPFRTELGRFYKAIVQLKDQSTKPDQAQLEAMPTDFCRDLYTQITSMEGGKIVWSYAKPLLFGKILYTPNVPVVKEIIQKANSSFAPMFKLVSIVHSFANTVPALEKLNDHRDGLKGLTDLLSEPQYTELLSNVIGNVSAPDVDVEKLFDSFGDIKDITGMIKKASHMLRCFDLNRFRAVSNESELGHEAGKLTSIREFSAGLVFMNISEKDTRIPSNVEYKIRMDIENAPTTRRLKNFLWIPGPEENFLEDMRYFRGFIQIQDTIEKAIIELSVNQSRRIQKREENVDEQSPMNWATYTQQIPYPCYIQDFFQTSLYASQALIVAFFFSLLFTVSSAVRFIVADKETGNTMLMSVMGVNLRYHTLSWFVACALEMAATVAVMTAILYFGNVLPRTDPSLVFTLFIIYGFSALSFCYMISKLFSSASFAAVCTGIAFLCTFMPFVIILSLEAVLTNSLKIIVSLSSSSSVCYALLYLTRYEATGTGAGWAQVWDSPEGSNDMSIGIATCMVICDAVLYLIIGLVLDYFLGIRSESNITNCQAVEEKAGVSILNVTKVYGNSRNGKVALDGVSMELVKGQITALLGHNGAGKTTLVKIITGMLKPTSGHVIVRSEDGSRTTLGVCPQRDVLYEYMTAEEHVALYAQLKSGKPLGEVQDEVDSLLEVLSLGEARREAAARLSGGTRRRLCVALAFVARPHLVSLDEPTAGVDPAARRDIWAMITRLRAGRTILLTTHHLDEAELLSDQIVIMHKGQIHTTGSPIEIKRSLGSGYKLTVTYPDMSHGEDSSEEDCLQEKTKNLLAAARSVVRNANLVDIDGLEVEINLPFFDQDGVSNDFPQLCCTLEEQQAALEFESYDMECSSLEQVFYNICHQADATATSASTDNEVSSKSASTSSVRSDRTPLVPVDGPLCAPWTAQLAALLHLRLLHYSRNRWLLFLLVALPSIFVTLAMAFSTVRPPADVELALRLDRQLYEPTTDFMVMNPSIQGEGDPTWAQKILDTLRFDTEFRNWTEGDSPVCKCVDTVQQCDVTDQEPARPRTMVFSDVHTLNSWLVDSQKLYVSKRYGGFSATIRNGTTALVAWYNNKGHHAMPAYVTALHSAARRALTGDPAATIALHTHPLKISEEQINKDTVYQHVADAGISCMLVVGYSLVSAGGAVYLVTARRSREKRLQLLAGVSPALYWSAALIWDLLMILVNIVISAVILELFHFPVFVERNNLPAICILIFLYGYACSGLVHLLEKLFSEPSLANMMLFCGNCFVGLAGITVLLILDIISDSDATDNARWVLHKVFMLSPQFALADGLLEVAKNTIQGQVLGQFGLDTYRDPLGSDLLAVHLSALVLVGTVFIALNLAVEYDCFESLVQRFHRKRTTAYEYAIDSDEVRAEAERVRCSLEPLRLRTIGNINAGYVVTETDMDPIKTGSLKRWSTSASLRGGAGGAGAEGDAAACVQLGRVYRTSAGYKHAVRDLTLGIPRGQCTALLGENGAGKSTTFAMLTGELRPSAGVIHLDGAPATPRDLCRGLISYCPQQDAIDPLLTVRETLRFYCRLRGIDNEEEVIRRTVDMFDLGKYTAVRSGALSGGNKRKLCTAIAFMGRTPLVLLDEPTSGMDPGSRGCVWRGVAAACGAGRAALLSTHALADARRAATRVALMRHARLQAVAPLDHCLKRFGGGWVCACHTPAGMARAAWRRVVARSPASLQLLHDTALHVVVPELATVDGKEVRTRLSLVFRLLAELQAAGLVRDYTVNRTDLDQMFLSYSDKQTVSMDDWDGAAESRDDDVVTSL